MKKTYIAPKSNLVEIETTNILAGSDVTVHSAGNGDDAMGKHNLNGDEWDFDED